MTYQDPNNRRDDELGPRYRSDAPQPNEFPGEATVAPPQEGRLLRLPLPTSKPRAFMVLLVINVLVFAIPMLLGLVNYTLRAGIPIDPSTGDCVSTSRLYQIAPFDYITLWGEKLNCRIADYSEYYRFLTAMFLHGSLIHIAFNGFALYSIGPEAERLYGTGRFLLLYFIAGFAGGVASYALSPSPSVGASGAIFGLIGGLAAFFFASRKVLGDVARQQLGSLLTVVLINLFIGFTASNIDNFAHLGGLFGGAVVGYLLAPRFVLDERLYPPQVVRRALPLGWVGALGVFALLAVAAVVIRPPL